MKIVFADTLYFKEDNILKIILGSHRTNKLISQEIIVFQTVLGSFHIVLLAYSKNHPFDKFSKLS